MEAVQSITGTGTAQNTQATRDVIPELDRDAFLRLLVLQLQNQNPLEPISNEDMLAQLAQFAALEQMNKLNESFEAMRGNIDQLNFISASQLLGKQVEGIDVNGIPRQGVVERVGLNGSVVELIVNGQPMSMAGIIAIDNAPASTP